MPIIVHLIYKGAEDNAKRFAEEMESTGIAQAIRRRPGNLKYEYYVPLNEADSVLLIDMWANQAALDDHHASEQMDLILELRAKYNLEVTAERFVIHEEDIPESDRRFLEDDSSTDS